MKTMFNMPSTSQLILLHVSAIHAGSYGLRSSLVIIRKIPVAWICSFGQSNEANQRATITLKPTQFQRTDINVPTAPDIFIKSPLPQPHH
ncbi:uncharacterized protein K441DRAFT_162760 [Cenococcum geophilum 1.58]|uniref:uncharacterized protein n=1 Tax=Cenococcum geophilum 1.58 TaxID=794803 RepID=UPI00358EF6AA|nr:hypothetical protein K441DRAFT_162760 [Cenococcum geophilum 1.58]